MFAYWIERENERTTKHIPHRSIILQLDSFDDWKNVLSTANNNGILFLMCITILVCNKKRVFFSEKENKRQKLKQWMAFVPGHMNWTGKIQYDHLLHAMAASIRDLMKKKKICFVALMNIMHMCVYVCFGSKDLLRMISLLALMFSSFWNNANWIY